MLGRFVVAGGSAGALPAAELARRHPDRCTHLVLLVPAANLTGRDPVEFSALQRLAVERVLTSDVWFRTLLKLAPDQLLRTLLATDPALLDSVGEGERRRAGLILHEPCRSARERAGSRTTATIVSWRRAAGCVYDAVISRAGAGPMPRQRVLHGAPDTPRSVRDRQGTRHALAQRPSFVRPERPSTA